MIGVLEEGGIGVLSVAVATDGAAANGVMSPRIRARVRWERRDLVREPTPPGRRSLSLCRNVVIYLTREAKGEIHGKLAEALYQGGFVMLGRAERVADPAALGLDRVGPTTYRRRR
jgi:chemotaxis protein methyltransferase CheR